MAQNKVYNQHDKIRIGPTCKWGCCAHPNSYGCNPKKMKAYSRRFVRRVDKLDLKKELVDEAP